MPTRARRSKPKTTTTPAATTVRISYSKGVTVSKDFQSTRYDIGIEMDVEMAPGGFAAEVRKLEEMVNAELRARLNKGDFHRLG